MALFPNLQVQAGSGLAFPWVEFNSRSGSVADISMGPDGVAMGMVMIVFWDDLEEACQALLGYSYRDTDLDPVQLGRVLPWRHPYWTQLWCTRIVKVQGLDNRGKDDGFGDGPFTDYAFARLTLQFTRPPYAILDDLDPLVNLGLGGRQEWMRYTDRFWTPSIQILSREGMQYKFVEGAAGSPLNRAFPGSVGQKLSKVGLKRTWYQIPEKAVYNSAGFPANLIYSLGDTTIQLLGCVNNASFFGCAAGTLLYTAVEITPRPLHLPAFLMDIQGESVQLQYDVTFHYEYFDPPIGGGGATTHGHNCMPYAKDGLWYKVASQVGGTLPFPYAVFPNMFKIL